MTFESEESASIALAEMHGYCYERRSLTVKPAEARGQEKEKKDQDVKLNENWKTVPTPRKSGRHSKDDYCGNSRVTSPEIAPRKTWDEWAVPVKEPTASIEK